MSIHRIFTTPFASVYPLYVQKAQRKNRSQEAFDTNKARLTNYLSKLVLYPRHEKNYVSKAKTGILNDTAKVHPPSFRISRKSSTLPLSTLSLPLSSVSEL